MIQEIKNIIQDLKNGVIRIAELPEFIISAIGYWLGH